MLSILHEELAAGASIAFCCVLYPEQPLPSAFWPPPSLQLLNSPLVCLFSKNFSSYFDVFQCVDVADFVSPHQIVSSLRAGSRSDSTLKSGTQPRGSIQMCGVEQNQTFISVPG